jgi:6-phosphofructokinase 2
MASVLTLTMNPTIDLSMSVDCLEPTRKLRCTGAKREAGGGGINVARVVHRLGSHIAAIYPTGGITGQLLRQLVDKESITSVAIPVGGETRENFTVLEVTTGEQYRFVLTGPKLSESEWLHCLEAFAAQSFRPDIIVASGSLPPGVPDDFYGRIAEIAAGWGIRMALDASGSALKAALDHRIFLIKPNLRELQELTGASLTDQSSQIAACRALVSDRKVQVVALTLGEKGALLITDEDIWRAGPLTVESVSAIGAGDSFLGGMAWALASGLVLDVAFKFGIAAGSATVLSPGTELCQATNVRRLVEQVTIQRLETSECTNRSF